MSSIRQTIGDHKLLAGVIGGMALSAAIAGTFGLYLMFGGFNTAASSPHSGVVAWAVHMTMEQSVKSRAPRMAQPVAVSNAALLSGAAEYGEHCMECHGGPGVPRAKWVSAMLPTPPYLLDAGKRWSRGELFEVINHGVKMTAMPAWGEVMPRDKVEDVTTFVEYLPTFKPAQFAQLMKIAREPQDDEKSIGANSLPSGAADGDSGAAR